MGRRPSHVALRRRYGEQQDDREGKYQDTRATAEPERGHDPDEVRPGLPDAFRLDGGEYSGRDRDRDEERDPAAGRHIIAVGLGSARSAMASNGAVVLVSLVGSNHEPVSHRYKLIMRGER